MKRLLTYLLLAASVAQAGPIVINGPVYNAAAGPTILATDSFNRANEALSASANWADGTDASFAIVSNAATTSGGGGDNEERYVGITWPNDQYCKVTLGTTSADGVGVGYGPAARMAAGKTLYRAICNGSGYEVARFNAGAFTGLASGSGTTCAVGDVLTFQIVGAVWSFKKGVTTLASGTDGSPIASGTCGIAYSSSATASNGIDSFEGGSP